MSKNSTEQKKAKTEKNTAAVKAPAVKAAAPAAKPYFAGIDILKILAVFFVVSVHTFLYSGFYSASIDDRKYIIPIAYRWLSYTCVPIFMTVTGYLMKNKKISAKYYLGVLRVVVIYIVISIPCMMCNKKYFHTEFTPWSVIKGFFEYSNANYAWYVNFYIALFFVIPFLNLAFNGLQTKGQKLTLVITVTLLTVFARSFFIGFENGNQIRIFPDYLSGVWPFAYYFAGAYIRDYPPKKCLRNKIWALMVLICAICFLTESTYNQSYDNIENNRIMLSYHFNDYSSYPVFIATISIFLLLFDITTRNKGVKFVIRQLSEASFALYLISYVFDREIYTEFVTKYPNAPDGTFNFDRWTHVYEPLFYTFFHALFWALIISNGYRLLEYLVKLCISKLKKPAADAE